jgi:hypothetical protein
MNARLCLCVAAIGFAALTLPARADDLATVQAKMSAAAAGVTSFVVTLRVIGDSAASGSVTFVRPMNVKSEFASGQMSMEAYLVDGMVYVHLPEGGWQKSKAETAGPAEQYLNLAAGGSASAVLLPDREEDGATVGVFQMQAVLPGPLGPFGQPASQPIACSYDKTTYLIRSCRSASITLTYMKYNDPANTVVLPAAAKSAPLVVRRTPPAPALPALPPPVPAPAASTSPAPG